MLSICTELIAESLTDPPPRETLTSPRWSRGLYLKWQIKPDRRKRAFRCLIGNHFGTDIPEDIDALRAGAALNIEMAEGSARGCSEMNHTQPMTPLGFGLAVVFHSDGKGEIDVTVTLKRPALRRS